MTTARDLFSNQKTKKSKKKGKNIPPGFLEMLKQSGEIYTPESSEDKRLKEKERKEAQKTREKAQAYFQRVKKIEKEVYSRKKRETKKEIELLRETLAKEVEQLKKQGQSLQSEIQAATQQPVVNPGQSDVSFFENIIRFVRQLTRQVEDAALWMEAWNQKKRKRGAFWTNFASKKGGAQYLLSSEHYVSRSAG